MNKLISLIALSFLLAVTSNAVFAGKIYKWVDKQGEVHYSEHPPAGNAEQMHIHSSSHASTTHAAPSTPQNNMKAANKFLDSVNKQNKEQKEASDKAAKEKAIKDKNCSIAKRRVASLKIGGRKFEVDEKGNRHYLDDADIQKQLNEAQGDVAKYCQ